MVRRRCMVRPWPSAIVVSVIIEGFDRDASGPCFGVSVTGR